MAAQSPARQRLLRRAAIAHVLVLTGTTWAMTAMSPAAGRQLLGFVALVAGIVEGATLLG